MLNITLIYLQLHCFDVTNAYFVTLNERLRTSYSNLLPCKEKKNGQCRTPLQCVQVKILKKILAKVFRKKDSLKMYFKSI